MVDNRPITTPSEALLREMKDLLRRDRARNDRSRRKRIPQPGKDRSRETGGGDSGTDCGCCNPTHCLTLPDGIDATLFSPSAYTLTVPTALDCQCEESPGGKIVVRRVNATNIYESESIQCYGPTTETVPCTTKANWIWIDETPESECEGDCKYNSAYDVPSEQWYWALDLPESTCVLVGDCGCQSALGESTGYEGDLPTGLGQTLTTGCNFEGNEPEPAGHWELVSVDDESCTCTPVEPDFDGTVDGQLAQTDCTGTKSASGEDALQDSFWRLTIGELGAYCQNTTKLDFIVGETVVLTYALARPCKPFCPLCENKFELNQCGPFDCESIPGVVCIKPSWGVDCETCLEKSVWVIDSSDLFLDADQIYLFPHDTYDPDRGVAGGCVTIDAVVHPPGELLCAWQGYSSYGDGCNIIVRITLRRVPETGELFYELSSGHAPFSDACFAICYLFGYAFSASGCNDTSTIQFFKCDGFSGPDDCGPAGPIVATRIVVEEMT